MIETAAPAVTEQSFADFKKAEVAKKTGTSEEPKGPETSTVTEPVVSAPKGETPAPESGTKENNQDGQAHKRDRSAAGRAKELIAQGREKEADEILRNASKGDRDRLERLEEELRTLRTRKPDQAEPEKPAAEPKTEQAKELKAFVKAHFEKHPDDAYEDAVEAFYADKLNPDKLYEGFEKRAEEKRKKEAEAKQAEEHKTAYNAKIAKAQEKYSDFGTTYDAAVEAAEGLPNTGAQQALSESDALGELLYHFGKNPEEMKGILKLAPPSAYRAIVALELKLSTSEPTGSATPAKAKIPPSASPAPPASIGGSGTTHVRSPMESGISMAEFKRRESARKSG